MADDFMTLPETMRATGLPRSTLLRKASNGGFPARELANGGKSRAIVFRRSAVEAWLAGRYLRENPASRIEGAHFRLPEFPNMARAAAAVRRLALYGLTGAITPTTGTRAIVSVACPPGRDARKEGRDLQIFFPDLRFTYHDERGERADISAAPGTKPVQEPAVEATPDWLAS